VPPATAVPSSTPAPAPQTDTGTSASQPAETTAAATQTAQSDAPLRDEYHQPPRDTVSQQVYDGWKQYNLNCARCHGEDVQGTTIAPHLIVSLKPEGPIKTKEAFVQTVCAGRPEKGMPAWCPLGMEMPTIEAIYAYVKGRSDAKIHPGRPALRPGG
jgi:mono/diheme cytochrome c family protein